MTYWQYHLLNFTFYEHQYKIIGSILILVNIVIRTCCLCSCLGSLSRLVEPKTYPGLNCCFILAPNHFHSAFSITSNVIPNLFRTIQNEDWRILDQRKPLIPSIQANVSTTENISWIKLWFYLGSKKCFQSAFLIPSNVTPNLFLTIQNEDWHPGRF